MADTSLVFNILARGGKEAASQFLAVSAAADKVNKKTSKLQSLSFNGLTTSISKLSSVTLAAGKGLLFVAAGAASLNTAIQAGTALAPLAGGIALLPGVALGAAAAIGTLKLATSGMSDAFKAAMGNDPKQYAAALKELSPAARSVAVELHKLRPELQSIQKTAQQNLFKPLKGQLTDVAKVLVGPVKQGVADVAIQFGLAGKSVAEFARQSDTVALVRSSFGQLAVSIHALLPALQPVLAGFRALATEGQTFLPQMAASVGSLATKFGVWLQQIVASGKATEWIKNALATFKQLFGIIGQVGGILKSVFSAASAAGSNFLGVIGSALSQLNAFLKTAAGQAALKSIFQSLATIGATLGPVIGALVSGLGELAAPIGRLASMIGPILTKAIKALVPALTALEPGFAAIFKALGQAVSALSPALVPLADAISQIVVALAPLLPLFAKLVTNIIVALAPAIPPLVDAIAQFAAVLGTQLIRVIQQLAPYIPNLAIALGQVLIALTPLLPPLATLLIALTPIIPVITALVQFLAPLAPYIVAITLASKAWAVTQGLLNVVMSANPIGLIVIAIAGLIAVIVLIATKTDWFQKIWHAAWGAIKGAASAVFNWLKSNWPYVLGILTGPVGLAVAYITKHWDSVVNFVKGLPGRIARASSGMWNGVTNAFRGAINWIISRWNNFSLSLGGWRVNLPFGMGFTIPSVTLRTPNIPYLATGGKITGSGMAMVGEKGPELVNLPRGADVISNSQSRSMLGASTAGSRASGGNQPAVIELRGDGTKASQFLMEMIRESVKIRGGNVQVVLGG